MKFVATRNFLNVAKLSIKPDTTQVHQWPKAKLDSSPVPAAIFKGQRFSIGDTDVAKDLSPGDQEKVLWLYFYKMAVTADDKAVPTLDKKVAAEIAQKDKESKPAVSMEEAIGAAVAKATAEATNNLIKLLIETGAIKGDPRKITPLAG